ncbi:MAG: UTRA domain-containing protein, partial [Atribacterota bacterium]
ATHGTNQALSFGIGGTLNISLDGTGELGAGWHGAGSIAIADGVPVAFITNYLLSRIIPDLPEKIQSLREKGLYQLLEEEYGIRLEKAVETIEAYNSGPLEMELLQIPEETPLFHTVRITSLDDGTPFELVASIIRADKYEYRVYLQGRPPVT